VKAAVERRDGKHGETAKSEDGERPAGPRAIN
jgi:hypothetical protein